MGSQMEWMCRLIRVFAVYICQLVPYTAGADPGFLERGFICIIV